MCVKWSKHVEVLKQRSIVAFGGGWSRQVGSRKDPLFERFWNGLLLIIFFIARIDLKYVCSRSSNLTGFPTVLSCGARGQSTPRFELSQPKM